MLSGGPLFKVGLFVAEVVLPLQPPPRTVKFAEVIVDDEGGDDEAGMMPLRALARKSDVRVKSLVVRGASTARLIEWGKGILGAVGVPETLALEPDLFFVELHLGKGPAPQLLPVDADRNWPAHGTELAALALELIAQRLEWESSAAAAAASGSADAPASGAVSLSTAPLSRGPWDTYVVLHVRGPFVASLARDPAVLRSFVKLLQVRAVQSAGSGSARVHSYMVVPGACTLIVEFAAKDVAVIAAAVRAELAAAGHGDSSTVEVGDRDPYRRLMEACEAFWHSGLGGSKAERIRLLLTMVEGLFADWPDKSLLRSD